MKIPVITSIHEGDDGVMVVLRSIYTPDPDGIGNSVLYLRPDDGIADFGEPVAGKFKTDNPTDEDRALARKVAAALGVADDAEWWSHGTIVNHPLNGEIAARLLPIMAEEQRILAQLLEVRERLRVEREKVEGLRFVEVEVP